MDLFGDEYIDNNLVFCSSNGRPMESQVINRAFNKLIKENGLPHVVFHSLRHSSITYKLKLNGGDMKSVRVTLVMLRLKWLRMSILTSSTRIGA